MFMNNKRAIKLNLFLIFSYLTVDQDNPGGRRRRLVVGGPHSGRYSFAHESVMSRRWIESKFGDSGADVTAENAGAGTKFGRPVQKIWRDNPTPPKDFPPPPARNKTFKNCSATQRSNRLSFVLFCPLSTEISLIIQKVPSVDTLNLSS